MSYADELVAALGKEKVRLDPADRFVYGADWSPRTLPSSSRRTW
jgi:hypothetical protein